MFHSTKIYNCFHAITTLILVFALGAVAFLFTGCSPAPVSVPVTSADRPAEKSAGVVSNVEARSNTNPVSGYNLVTNAQGVRIVSPETPIQPADKAYDLGAGYLLVTNAQGGKIIPPATFSTDLKQVNLGSGYVLEITGESARILLPKGYLRPGPQDPALHRENIGGGFWLITGTDGGFILQEGSK